MSIVILYGSEMGTTEDLASQAQSALQGAGLEVEVKGMEDMTAGELASTSCALIMTSTWGDGEPPSNAEELYEALSEGGDFSGLSYAVFGIGSTSFEHFCKAAQDFDSFLSAGGATRISDTVLCDDDYDEKLPVWIEEITAKLK